LPCFFISALWQNGQFFIHISKRGLKALYYKALSHFLATILSTMPEKIYKQKCATAFIAV
ncbi:MAG TPA: hypothetical protein K8W15_12420, partial [Gallibacterium anatis]|nr:hypothetical protein [Gallibacterium anatis]